MVPRKSCEKRSMLQARAANTIRTQLSAIQNPQTQPYQLVGTDD
jgi:hypothetical protein